MKVLITGATGFLGRNLIPLLDAHEITWVGIGRNSKKHPIDGEFINADLLEVLDFTDLMAEAKADHLLHLAWYAEHGKYWSSPLNLRWTETTVRLVEAFCRAGGVKVVAAGTCAEYDWEAGYCREDTTPLRPHTLYGVCKDATRRIVEAVCHSAQVPLSWARIFWPTGPGEDSRRLIPSLVAVVQGRKRPFGVNGDAYRDLLHVKDVAEALVCLLMSQEAGAFNISSGKPIEIRALIEKIARIYKADPTSLLARNSCRPGDPPLLVGHNFKIRSLGWEPQTSPFDHLGRESGRVGLF